MSRRVVSNARLSRLQPGRRAARRWPRSLLALVTLGLIATALLLASGSRWLMRNR